MARATLTVLVLPFMSLLLLGGIVAEAHAAEPATVTRSATAPRTQASAPRDASVPGDFRIAAPARCCAGTGGPFESVAAEPEAPTKDVSAARWRLADDVRAERRFAPPPATSLNRVTIRF